MPSFAKVSKAITAACKLHGVTLSSDKIDKDSIIPLVTAEVVKTILAPPPRRRRTVRRALNKEATVSAK